MKTQQLWLAVLLFVAYPAASFAQGNILEDFLGTSLDQTSWALSCEYVGPPIASCPGTWASEVKNGELVVYDIDSQGVTDNPWDAGNCSMILSRPFQAPGEFDVCVKFRWNCDDGPNDGKLAMQAFLIKLRSSAGKEIAAFGYFDHWNWRYGVIFSSMWTDNPRGFPEVGHEDDVTVRATRNAANVIRIYWNEIPLDGESVNAAQIDELQLVFDHSPYVDSSFGTIAVDRVTACQSTCPHFRRGDSNASGAIDIADAIFTLDYLFAHGQTPSCLDSADANDDGEIDLSDAIRMLLHLFAHTGPLKPPFVECGIDPTDDTLDCLEFGPCQ